MVIEVVKFSKLENLFFNLLNMLTKKDLHILIGFHNHWIDDKNVTTYINSFRGMFVSVRFAYYNINEDGSTGKLIFSIEKMLKSKADLNVYKADVLSQLTNHLLTNIKKL